jgi:transcription elongation factor Elf1
VVEQPSALATTVAPKLEHGDAGTRDAECVHCGAGISVPLTITIPTVSCASCGKTEPVSRYVSDGERFQLDMARQLAGNQQLRELLHTGLTCPRCGAHNALSEPVPVQIACSSCRHTILLSDFAPADAVDRARLKQTALEFKQGLLAKQEANARRGRYIAFAIVAGLVIAILTAAILTQT